MFQLQTCGRTKTKASCFSFRQRVVKSESVSGVCKTDAPIGSKLYTSREGFTFVNEDSGPPTADLNTNQRIAPAPALTRVNGPEIPAGRPGNRRKSQ